MKANLAAKGAGRYIVGPVERFDQKNEMFKRVAWDPTVQDIGMGFFGGATAREDKPGYTLQDVALRNAAWYLEFAFGRGIIGGGEGLYAWESRQLGGGRPPAGSKVTVDNPAQMTKAIKKAAGFLGASLVGICGLDRRWVYSYSYHVLTGESAPVEIPEECKYAVVLAIEMDYTGMQFSPTQLGGATTGLGYSKMAFTTGLLAQYIRGLGYQAIPMGNDTALSIPIAVDAGLGELARNGLLITREFGPRVRLSKIFTDLPLVADEPIEFGVWDFCRKCIKCAHFCPSQSILYGEPTDKPHTISNNTGLLRWPVNTEQCLRFWAANGTDCSNCIRVCPFNKPPGWLHTSVRWGVEHTRWLDSLFVKMDDFFGYDKQVKAEHFWE